MYCRNCGSQVNDKAEFCLKCGVRPFNAKAYCQECGVETNEKQEICIKCCVRLKTLTSSKGITLPNGLPLEINERVFRE